MLASSVVAVESMGSWSSVSAPAGATGTGDTLDSVRTSSLAGDKAFDPDLATTAGEHRVVGAVVDDRTLALPPRVEDDATYLGLLARRAELSVQELEGTLTAAESRQLTFARWMIDRIELERAADDLHRLRGIADLQERLAEDIQRFVGAVRGTPKRR